MSKSTDIDHFDIAAIKLDDKIIHKHKINVIKKDMFATSIEVVNPHCRVVAVFLASKNKQVEILDEKKNRINSYSFTYLGFANFQGDYSRFGKSQDRHEGLKDQVFDLCRATTPLPGHLLVGAINIRSADIEQMYNYSWRRSANYIIVQLFS